MCEAISADLEKSWEDLDQSCKEFCALVDDNSLTWVRHQIDMTEMYLTVMTGCCDNWYGMTVIRSDFLKAYESSCVWTDLRLLVILDKECMWQISMVKQKLVYEWASLEDLLKIDMMTSTAEVWSRDSTKNCWRAVWKKMICWRWCILSELYDDLTKNSRDEQTLVIDD